MTAEERVSDLIRNTGMLKDGDRVIAAVSGGADSVFLFFVLRDLMPELCFRLSALHVNHGIRGDEADRDEAFVRKLCLERGIPCTAVRRDVPSEAAASGMSLEEAGRKARYEEFRAEAGRLGGAKIALAHHRGDLAETVLFRIARGTGIAGLSPMRPADGAILRPLLCVTKTEIEESLRRRGIPWVEDSTNLENDACRNRIRNIILPLLEEYVNSRASEHLAELSEQAGEAADFIAHEAEKRLPDHAELSADSCIFRDTVLAEHAAVRKEIFRICIGKMCGSTRDLTSGHLSDLTELFGKREHSRLDLPGGLSAARTRGGVKLAFYPEEKHSGEEFPAAAVSGTFPFETDFGEWHFSFELAESLPDPVPHKQYTKWFDYGKINGTAVIRTRRSGDRITVTADGGTKTLSDYFTDRKVPSEERDRIPLLACGSEILWVVGMRDSCAFRLDGRTERALRVRAYPKCKGADYE